MNPSTHRIAASRMTTADLLRAGLVGVGSRRVRAVLSALGISIGVASIIAVLGISQSSSAALNHQLNQLGTNLLTIQPGQTLGGQHVALPLPAERMATRTAGVQQVSAVADLPQQIVLRNRFIGTALTGGIEVKAARTNLLGVLHGATAQGAFLNEATGHYPVVVLGAVAAQRLGIATLRPGTAVWLGGRSFTVAGVLAPLPLAPDLDRSALIGYPEAAQAFHTDSSSSTVYVRADPNRIAETFHLLGPSADPAHPDQVLISQPSDALSAQLAAQNAFNSLFLGLGGVALLVGAIGIANIMVIAVLERRGEIGLRRAIGAAKRHIWTQFITESLMLSAFGGLGGSLIGIAVTAGYATYKHWQTVIPAEALAIGIGATLGTGAIAGLYPAIRAARLAPTDALRAG
jgi:putative ABC transport system permease protein